MPQPIFKTLLVATVGVALLGRAAPASGDDARLEARPAERAMVNRMKDMKKVGKTVSRPAKGRKVTRRDPWKTGADAQPPDNGMSLTPP